MSIAFATDTTRIQNLEPSALVRLTRRSVDERVKRAATHLRHNGQRVTPEALAESTDYEPAYVESVMTRLCEAGEW